MGISDARLLLVLLGSSCFPGPATTAPSRLEGGAGAGETSGHAPQRCEYSTIGRPEAWRRLSVQDAIRRANELRNQYVLVSGFLAHDGMLLCSSIDAKESECLGVDPWTELEVAPTPIAEACGHTRVSVFGTLVPEGPQPIPQAGIVVVFPATLVVTRLVSEGLP